MNRVLCIDYGERRVGIAVSDPLGLTAQAQPYIENRKSLMADIKAVVDEFMAGTVVVGLPLNRHGEDSQKTTEVRAFAASLSETLGMPVVFQDERYSTKAVEKHLIAADVSRKKRKEVVDSLAAAFILEGYLAKQNLS
jgi:putative Holliday junction resolvase